MSKPSANNIGDFLDKVPPQDLEAERCVLGSLLCANEAVDVVDPIISGETFYAEAHRHIYAAIYDLFQANRKSSVDAVTLRDELQRRGQLDEVGGVPYLLQLLEVVPHAEHAEYYAKIVRETHMQRLVIEACTETLKNAFNGRVKASSIVASAERKLTSIMESDVIEIGTAESVVHEMLDRMLKTIDNDELVDGIAVEWAPLRVLIDSFAETCLYILAARPAQGKTALALEIALKPAQKGDSVLIVSLEMPRVQLAQRLVSRLSGISAQSIRNGLVGANDDAQTYVMAAAEEVKRLPIRISDSRVNITQLKQIIRKEYRTKGTRLVVIDYLQLIDTSEYMLKSNKSDQVGEITRELKLLANELKIPIIVLSQLNRGVELRDNKTPRLSDLRDSGAIEQEADVVIFLHRPESYDRTDRPGIAVLTVAKNRHGPIGSADLNYDKTCGRFYVSEEQKKLGFDQGSF